MVFYFAHSTSHEPHEALRVSHSRIRHPASLIWCPFSQASQQCPYCHSSPRSGHTVSSVGGVGTRLVQQPACAHAGAQPAGAHVARSMPCAQHATATGGAASGCVIHQPEWLVAPLRSTASWNRRMHGCRLWSAAMKSWTGMLRLPGVCCADGEGVPSLMYGRNSEGMLGVNRQTRCVVMPLGGPRTLLGVDGKAILTPPCIFSIEICL